VDDKLPQYQARGDRVIWRLHPFERTLTAWSRQADGTYAVEVFHGGIVRIESLPGVEIDLDLIFDIDQAVHPARSFEVLTVRAQPA
jgi:hypothetical protein